MVVWGVLVFCLGAASSLVYYTLRSPVKKNYDDILVKRLEYYENMLVDLKILVDSQGLTPIPSPKKEVVVQVDREEVHGQGPVVGLSLVNQVLHLITSGSVTSRDIQIKIEKTREHTARLMKRLSDDGLVERDSSKRPYTYSITSKGREMLNKAGLEKTT